MSVRLIDANALKMRIQSGVDLIFDRATECEFIYMIDSQPAIEAEPVRRGQWECGGFCSECEIDNEERKTDYCPHCGARMDATDTKGGMQE